MRFWGPPELGVQGNFMRGHLIGSGARILVVGQKVDVRTHIPALVRAVTAHRDVLATRVRFPARESHARQVSFAYVVVSFVVNVGVLAHLLDYSLGVVSGREQCTDVGIGRDAIWDGSFNVIKRRRKRHAGGAWNGGLNSLEQGGGVGADGPHIVVKVHNGAGVEIVLCGDMAEMWAGPVLNSIQLVVEDTGSHRVVGGGRRHVGVRDQTLVGGVREVLVEDMRLAQK